jgi:hypothetical protein
MDIRQGTKLNDAVQRHGEKNWDAIAFMVAEVERKVSVGTDGIRSWMPEPT